MDEEELELRKQDDPSIPADYVSLAQLQHQWLQRNQHPKKLQRNQEEKEREGKPTQGIKTQNQNHLLGFQKNQCHVKMAGGFRRERNNAGREMGVIEDKGKGKEILIVGFENGDEKKLKSKQEEETRKPTQGKIENHDRLLGFKNEGNVKMAGGFRRERNGAGKETGVIGDKGKGKGIAVDGFESGVENRNQLGFKNEGNVKMAGGYRRGRLGRREGNDGGREMGVIEDNKGSRHHRQTPFPFENGSLIEDKGKGKEIVVDGFENGDENQKKKKKKKKWRKKKRYFRKGEAAEVGEKGNGVEEVNPSSEIKELDDGSEAKMGVLSGNDGAIGETESVYIVEVSNVETMESKGGSRYKTRKEYGGRYNRLKETEEKLDLERKMEDGKGRVKWREMRNSEYKEKYDRLKESRRDVWKGKNVEMDSKKKGGDGILEVCSEIAGSNGMVKRGLWGKRINRRNKTKECRVEGNGLKDNVVTVEKKVDKEVLGVESVKNDEKAGEIENGCRRRDVNKTKENGVEGNGLNDNRVIVEKKVDDEGLVVQIEKNGEKGEIGDGYRRSDGNMRGNICRKFEGLTFNERRAGNMRPRAETGFGERRSSRSYARFGGFERQCKIKQIESGMMWVKKDTSGTDGAGR